tara:strand:+ start:574 stop:744 length:171 start_codon:yes stop_codon:yes gene_type:complete
MTTTTALITIGVIWLGSFIAWRSIHISSDEQNNSGRSENDPVSIWNKYKRKYETKK